LRRAIVRQFGRPRGVLGHLAGLIMERRPSNRERNLRTLSLLEIQPEDRVLEVGFGPGFALSRAAELASRGRVLGVDHSEVMLGRASRRNATAIARGRMELRLEDAQDLSLPDGSIDKAYAVNVFMFWRDAEAVLRRLLRGLRPGGRLAITHQPRKPGATDDDTKADAERIAAAFERAGFAHVRVEVLPMKPVSAACVLASRPLSSGAENHPGRETRARV
jgi:ubiquinone/menaquinone biosynthesis C-methylase UbiE